LKSPPHEPSSSTLLDPRADLSTRLRAAMLGNVGSLEQLVDQLSPLMTAWSHAHLRRDASCRADPEDIVQDVWIKILPQLAELTPHPTDGRISSALLALLKTVLVRRTIDVWRASLRDKAKPAATVTAELPAPSSGPLRKLERSERDRLIRAALDEIPQRDRELYVRRIFEDLSPAELGDLYGMTRVAVVKARQRVRKRLEGILTATVLQDLEAD